MWDVKKAILEVENYFEAVVLSAQTALRDIIGNHELAEMLTQREQLGARLREVLDTKTSPWGMTILSVEIRDVVIPDALQDAMSKQAQAERERQARIILGTAETEIASKFQEAAQGYKDNPIALHLRAMNMLFALSQSLVKSMRTGSSLSWATDRTAPRWKRPAASMNSMPWPISPRRLSWSIG